MKVRILNTFEKLLLGVGLVIIIIGFGLIQSQYTVANEGITWDFLQTIFLWLLVVMFVIFLAVQENLKEELKEIISIEGKTLKTPKKRRK